MLTAMGFIHIKEIYCSILDWTHYPYSIRFEENKIPDLILVNLFQALCFRQFIGRYRKFKKYDGRTAE